jgi:hypothetical protein
MIQLYICANIGGILCLPQVAESVEASNISMLGSLHGKLLEYYQAIWAILR